MVGENMFVGGDAVADGKPEFAGALHSNGDFTEYMRYHLAQERRRVHETRYLDGLIPQAA